jgi:hypothetical protein
MNNGSQITFTNASNSDTGIAQSQAFTITDGTEIGTLQKGTIQTSNATSSNTMSPTTLFLNDTANNKSFTIDNAFATNSNKISTFTSNNANLEGTTALTTTFNDQALNFTSSNSTTATSKSLVLENAVGGGKLAYINNSGDATGLTIDSANNDLLLTSTAGDVNIVSNSAGGFINMTSVSSIDIEATGDNLTLTGGAVVQIEATGTGADIIIKPETTAGDLVFEGTNIESGSRGGSSGQNLRIKLNGTYYKIQLYDDT